ncbi:S41 family peptidase [Pedobacter agri]|uniref:S41 family peptidase n=1 Tax=Pedobacter agri TaxID=454586 RepID=A0A9X3DEY8_9SPHI|nr:S41 family peptidase [Pedobacter agri]MCX3264921.1 S41 family peptidase [Pedobacter agri]
MKFFTLILLLIIPIVSLAQNCDCLVNFDYVVESITKNYAGFNDKVKSKNWEEFLTFTQKIRNKSKFTSGFDSCYVNLRNWVDYFHDHHLRVQLDWKFRKNNPDVAKRLNKLFGKSNTIANGSENLATATSLKILDSTTVLLRLPSFEWSEKKIIDSILHVHMKDFDQRSNLILDMRGNSGGTDYAFNGLMPLIYSLPIKVKPDEYLSTQENIRILESNLSEEGISSSAKDFLNQVILLMKTHPGTFVNPSGKDFFEITLDSIYKYPSRIGILIDKNTASSAESFLLMAMQSKKVTVFGENSAGMLDYNNTQFFDIPCKNLNLVIPIGRSKRLPEQPIDNIGIKPDVVFDSKVTNRIELIRDLLNKQ